MNNLSKVNVFFKSTVKNLTYTLAQIPCRSMLSAVGTQSVFVSEQGKFPAPEEVCDSLWKGVMIQLIPWNGYVAGHFNLFTC